MVGSRVSMMYSRKVRAMHNSRTAHKTRLFSAVVLIILVLGLMLFGFNYLGDSHADVNGKITLVDPEGKEIQGFVNSPYTGIAVSPAEYPVPDASFVGEAELTLSLTATAGKGDYTVTLGNGCFENHSTSKVINFSRNNSTVNVTAYAYVDMVFWGWSLVNEVNELVLDETGNPVAELLMPGDVIAENAFEGNYRLKAVWKATNFDCTYNGDLSSKNANVTLDVVDRKTYTASSGFLSDNLFHEDVSGNFYTNTSPDRVSVIVLTNGTSLSGNVDVGSPVLFTSESSLIGSNTDGKVNLYMQKHLAYHGLNLFNDTRFEHMSLGVRTSGFDFTITKDHGDGGALGIFANGNRLVMGEAITNDSPDLGHVPQLFGGSLEGNITGKSCVIVNSGYYFNVVGGSRGGTIKDTHVVINGGVVLDTVVGGSANFVDVGIGTSTSTEGNVNGNTFVCINGGLIPGDYYEFSKYGDTNTYNHPVISTLYESSIITGGCNQGYVQGNTTVIVSGTADVWDVQGGGRRGDSSVGGTANVMVCGNGMVRHTVAGSITEGISTGQAKNTPAVLQTHVQVMDNARVCAVFGAGYDTFKVSEVPSIYGVQGKTTSITVDIMGGTVGYVYGGGYRGDVGKAGSAVDSVTINITGGTILHDVYGGGRGGLDRVFHADANGTLATNKYKTEGRGATWIDGDGSIRNSLHNSTGSSKLYAKSIDLNITGGVIKGNVYGGGQSIPYQKLSLGMEVTAPAMTKFVAAVYCDNISIDVHKDGVTNTNPKIHGSVFGVGNGVDTGNMGTLGILLYSDTGITKIPWLNGQPAYTTDSTYDKDYANYAYAEVTNQVSIGLTGYLEDSSMAGDIYGGGNNSSATVGSVLIEIDDSSIHGNIYSGGRLGGLVVNDSTISVRNGSEVNGTVMGGGLGSETNPNKGELETNGSISISVSNSTVGSADKSIVCGGDYASVIGSPIIRVNATGSSVLNGSVFGGGNLGKITPNSITIDITGSTVNGTVFGGGVGTGTIEKKDDGSVAVTGNITITINGSEIIPSDLVGVAGGGKYGYTSFAKVLINIVEKSMIHGDVHAGGVGYTYEVQDSGGNPVTKYAISAYGNRMVVLSDATVDGNIYGGSRLGSDGIENDINTMNDVYIHLLSGKVMQNVFGGGFQGESNLNPYIYLGAAAVTSEIGKPCGDLSVGSIFGGSNQKGSIENVVLLLGKPVIDISGCRQINQTTYRCNISVNGVIYGCGNYSKVGEPATISIEGFSNDKNHPISSIQTAGSLTVSDSVIFIKGGSRGDVLETTKPLSIGMVDSIVLRGGVTLHLMADTFAISGYKSMYNGRIALQEDTLQNTRNEIRMYNGKVFAVLGPSENGKDSGNNGTLIEGYTLLSIETDETYFGAYAMSSWDTVNGGFTIDRGRALANLLVGSETYQINTWYISGHSEKFHMISFEEGSMEPISNKYEMFQVGGSDTYFTYDGCSVEPTSKDSLVAIDGNASNSAATQMSIVLGVPYQPPTDPPSGQTNDMSFDDGDGTVKVVTHKFIDNAWSPSSSTADKAITSRGGNMLNVSMSILSNSGNNVGNLGDFIITFTEISVSELTEVNAEGVEVTVTKIVPVNIVDYRFSVYVNPAKSANVSISTTVSGVYRKDDGLYHATTHVILPTLDKRYSYGISVGGPLSVSSVDILADNSYNGISGWITSKYTSSPLSVADSGVDEPSFGTAGIKNATLTIDLSFTSEQSAAVQKFIVTATAEGGGNIITYTVNVKVLAADDIRMYFTYETYCGTDGTFDGNTEDYRYLAVTGDGTSGSPFIMDWRPCVMTDMNGTYTVTPAGNEVLEPFSFQYGSTPLKERFYFASRPGGPSSEATLESAVRSMVDKINGIDGELQSFDYGSNYTGLFTDKNTNKKFSPNTAVKEDSILFAGFALKVTFKADGIPLNFTEVLLKPGQTLIDKGLINIEEEIADVGNAYNHICGGYDRPGFTMKTFERGLSQPARSWVYETDQDTYFDFSTAVKNNISLTIPWESGSYTLNISFTMNNHSSDLTKIPSSVLLKETFPNNLPVDCTISGNLLTAQVMYGSTYSILLSGSGYVANSFMQDPNVSVFTDITDANNPIVKITKTGQSWNPVDNTINLSLDLVYSGSFTITLVGADQSKMSDGPITGTNAETVSVNGSPITVGSAVSIDYASLNYGADGMAEITVSSDNANTYYAFWDGAQPLSGSRNIQGTTLNIDVHEHVNLTLALYHNIVLTVKKETPPNPGNINYSTDLTKGYKYYVTSVDLTGIQKVESSKPSLIFPGYTVSISNGDLNKYSFPADVPGAHDVSINGSVATYVLDGGSRDVTLKLFRSGVVDINLTFENTVQETLNRYFQDYPTGHELKITIMDVERSTVFLFGESDLVLDQAGNVLLSVKASTKAKDYTVSCEMPGFNAVAADATAGLTSYSFTLSVRTYDLHFPNEKEILDDDGIYTYNADTSVKWSIVDNWDNGGSRVGGLLGDPAQWPNSCEIGGSPVWRIRGDQNGSLYYGYPDPQMFGMDGSAYLIPFEKIHQKPDGPGKQFAVYLTKSAFEWGPAKMSVTLESAGDLDFYGEQGAYATYRSGELTIYCENAGTGMLVLEDAVNDFTLEVVIFEDPTSVDGNPPLTVTLDASVIQSISDIQGSNGTKTQTN